MTVSSASENNAPAELQTTPVSRPRFSLAIVFLVWLPVVIVATLVTFILPESFSSTTRIKIERDRADVLGLAEPTGTVGYDPYFIQTEFEVLQSETILGKAVENLDLNNAWGKKFAGGVRLTTTEAISLLKNRLDLRPVRNTSLIEIRVFSEKPDEAAKIANEVAAVYKQHRQGQRKERSEGGIRALEEDYAQNEERIRDIRAEMAKLSQEPNTQNSNRLDEASRKLDALRRFGDIVLMKLAAERTDLSLPASSMVQIVDTAKPGLRPVRPNKPLNIAVATLVGGVGGFFLAILVYALQRREFRRRAGLPRKPFQARFRVVVHFLIAGVVGVIIGEQLATPLDTSTIIVVPLTLLLGSLLSAYVELVTKGDDEGDDDRREQSADA
jgi:capsular polysaccharide biosynthesis protein